MSTALEKAYESAAEWRTLFYRTDNHLRVANETVANLKKALSESISARDSLNTDYTNLRSELEGKEHVINSYKTDLAEAQDTIRGQGLKLGEQAIQLARADADFYASVEARDAALKANGELTKENAHLEAEVENLNKFYRRLSTEFSDARDEHDAAKNRISFLSDSNRDLLSENNQLSNCIGQLETHNRQLQVLVDGSRTSFKWHMGILTDMAAARTPRELADVSATSSDPDFSAAMSAVREAVTAFFDAQGRIADLEQTACGRVTALEDRLNDMTQQRDSANGDLLEWRTDYFHVVDKNNNLGARVTELERQVIDLDMYKQGYEQLVADLAPLQPARNADEWGTRISRVAMRRIAELEDELKRRPTRPVYFFPSSDTLTALERTITDLRKKLHEAAHLGHQIEQLNAQTT